MSKSGGSGWSLTERIRLGLRLMRQLPMVLLVVLILTLFWRLDGSMTLGLISGLAISAIVCEVLIQHPRVQRFVAWYVVALCAGDHSAECARLKSACVGREQTRHSLGLYMERLDKLLDLASGGLIAGIIRGVTLVLVLGSVMGIVVVWCHGLPELDRLELGALAGMAILACLAHSRLSGLNEKALKRLGFCLATILLLIVAAALPLIPGIWKVFARPFGRLAPELIHSITIALVALMLFVYDVTALRGLRSDAKRRPDHRDELLQMCVIVDVPMVVSLLVAAGYWQMRHGHLEKGEPKGLLTGAVVMQFVVSSLVFAIVKERLVAGRRLPEASNVKSRGAAAG